MSIHLKRLGLVAVFTSSLIPISSVLAFGNDDIGPSLAEGANIGSDSVLLALYVSLALGFSFLCSVAEAVLLSITPSYIEGLKEKRPKRAARLKRLKQDNIDRSLSAILTLNTIAHTVGAIGAGAKATVVFGSAWFGIFSAVMTLMILFFSEIVPKTIGAVYWPQLVAPTSHFINTLIGLLYPIVWISEKITKSISHGKNLPVFSREEFVAMASIGERTGQLGSKESMIIQNLFRFDSLKVTDVMTPRTVMSALPEEMTINDSLKQVTQKPFSRIPVYKTNIDDIEGFVLKGDILVNSAQGQGNLQLKDLKRGMLPVPESASLTALFEHFLKSRSHIAIVLDEHGGTEGLVTLEDLIETLMGMEIMDETDNVKDMRVLAREQWKKRAKSMGIPSDITEPEKAR